MFEFPDKNIAGSKPWKHSVATESFNCSPCHSRHPHLLLLYRSNKSTYYTPFWGTFERTSLFFWRLAFTSTTRNSGFDKTVTTITLSQKKMMYNNNLYFTINKTKACILGIGKTAFKQIFLKHLAKTNLRFTHLYLLVLVILLLFIQNIFPILIG